LDSATFSTAMTEVIGRKQHTVQVDFDYDPALDSTLSGRGTTTLTLLAP
jgi:hypothetical protein